MLNPVSVYAIFTSVRFVLFYSLQQLFTHGVLLDKALLQHQRQEIALMHSHPAILQWRSPVLTSWSLGPCH